MLAVMARKSRADARGDMLQGTVDMLILRTLSAAPAHGHTIANVIDKSSDEVLQVEHGSLYPALHRLEDLGMSVAVWARRRTTARRSTTGLLRPDAGICSRSGAGGTCWPTR